MAYSYEQKNSTSSEDKVVSRTVCILLVVLALLIGAAGGFIYGKEKATSDAQKALQQEITALEDDLNKAKTTVGNEAEEGQETVEALQTENAELKKTINEQSQKITDLEKQLAEANNSNTPQ